MAKVRFHAKETFIGCLLCNSMYQAIMQIDGMQLSPQIQTVQQCMGAHHKLVVIYFSRAVLGWAIRARRFDHVLILLQHHV